jgi:hypothetical protein
MDHLKAEGTVSAEPAMRSRIVGVTRRFDVRVKWVFE